MVDIDFIGNFFPTTNGSFGVVARNMIEGLHGQCGICAYNTMGIDTWKIFPQTHSLYEERHKNLYYALRRGESKTSFDHVGIVHGHVDRYDPVNDLHEKSYNSFVDRYKKRVLMTVNESEPIPGAWASSSGTFHKILVPSKYCRDVWGKQMDIKKVEVVPHGVEDFFKPIVNLGGSTDNFAINSLAESHDPESDNYKFKFLNIFTARSYPHRKGIDVLLDAYFSKYSKKDQVQLVISTEDKLYLQNLINDMIEKHDSSADYRILPPDAIRNVWDLVKLYNVCDCFISPHRGEAFGLDITNAKACGLPTIVTKYSGPVDFAGEGENEWIDIEMEKKLPKLVAGTCYSNEVGMYAEPKVDSLVQGMEKMFMKPKRRQKAVNESAVFREKWSWRNAGKACIKAVEGLVN